MKDFDRYYGLVVVPRSWREGETAFMLLFCDPVADTDIEAWRFIRLHEDVDPQSVSIQWITFGSEHGWVPL